MAAIAPLSRFLATPLSEDGRTIDSTLTASSAHVLDGAPARAPREADSSLALFALGASISLGEDVAQLLGAELAPLEDREFEDGEYKIRPLENVRGRDCYVVFTLHGDRCREQRRQAVQTAVFHRRAEGRRRCSASRPSRPIFASRARIGAPSPAIRSRRVTSRSCSRRLERTVLVCIDVHNIAAFQNAFRCETVHLDAQALFARHVVADIGDRPVAVVSPDLGGEKRAELFRLRLERMLKRPVAKAFMDKYRSEGRVVGDIFAGDVKDRIAIIIDDLIAGGGTVARTAAACRANGAARVWVAATHGVFSEKAASVLKSAPIDQAHHHRHSAAATVHGGRAWRSVDRWSASPVSWPKRSRRLHANGSITQLLEEGP